MAKKKVLIVDDHPSIRFLLRSLIETNEFTVCGEATDGVEAIQKADELRPDLILLDFSMPRMNGGEAAPILKKRLPGTPIILFTLHEDSVNKALAAEIGVDGVLAKPDGMAKLLECMRDVLGLAAKQSDTIGPLALPVDGAPEIAEIPSAALPDEKPPE
jgi:DNA-binding NarL/FixJ family response regulator